jgi:hypothetical protein
MAMKTDCSSRTFGDDVWVLHRFNGSAAERMRSGALVVVSALGGGVTWSLLVDFAAFNAVAAAMRAGPDADRRVQSGRR